MGFVAEQGFRVILLVPGSKHMPPLCIVVAGFTFFYILPISPSVLISPESCNLGHSGKGKRKVYEAGG